MNKRRLIKYINLKRLVCVIQSNSTPRVCYTCWYVIVGNNLEYVGSHKSSAIGTSRAFDCWRDLMRDYGIRTTGEVSQYFKVLGDN